MPGTGVPLVVGSYAAGQALLIVAITVLPVCLTVIALVLLVEPRERVEAIRELAPALLFTRFRRRRAEDDSRSPSYRTADGRRRPARRS
jgi:hypothetical protein